ncbi:LysR family transcriptional regulator [Vibrio sp. SS-MA-C1-2]|uniref:LysR family transcriptional regulator n=1 Tax=Vibrio sp. SS-MA-C1-2 TaxID=2908646 RepID=UPI001F421C17|nr:LysR family transcriptional regulator [Vibrio sp. SS-MA-C1-2]UJF17639.1 LysR family transcriptional regulator [Vibrio sp. SS-MA-C1-2]
MLLEDLQVILKIAEMRSITAAATSLNMRTATASAALKRVEKSLDAELFIRTTRQLRLSALGERYLPQCEQALLLLEQAKQNMRDDLDIVDGELRLSLSSDLGRNFVIPWLDEFLDQHPKVSLKINISDSNIDFYRDSVDLALRYGSPSDSNLYGFKVCDVPDVLCASSEYIAAHGTPKYPHDLVNYNGLFYQLFDVTHDVWQFSQIDNDQRVKDFKVKMSGNRFANDGELVRRWCVAGKGIAVKSSIDISSDLLSGRLVNVMPEFTPKPTELWLVCPSKQSITPAVRLFRDMCRRKSKEIMKQLIDAKVLSSH